MKNTSKGLLTTLGVIVSALGYIIFGAVSAGAGRKRQGK